MDDTYRRLSIISKIVFNYIKIRLLINARFDSMHIYTILTEDMANELESILLEEGYYISNYLPHIYLIEPVMYDK